MAEDLDGFFEFEPRQVKRATVKQSLDNPILHLDDNPNLNILVAEYFSERQLKHITAFFHQSGTSINLVYCFPFIADEKRQVSKLAKYFSENVRSDLNDWLIPDIPVVTVGRAIYAATFNTDIQVQGFYDSVFNNTFFYSPFVNNRVYPIDTLFKICGFGQADKKTGEPVYYFDRWETFFARKQIKKALKAGNCSLSRKKSIKYVVVENPDDWLDRHTRIVPDNELWAAIDSETGGFNKLSDPIGDITISFDGWTSYYLAWKNINPWIFHDFLTAHKIIGANLKFDFLFFMFHGVDKDIRISWDTMIAGHLLNEMRSNSLKTHAFFYTNYGGYDIELEKYKWKYPGLKSYLQIPDSIRIPYACMDAAVDYQVWQAQVRDMKKEPELWNYYHKYVLPMLKVTAKMEYNGFDIDWDKVTEVGGYIKDNIRKSLANIRSAFKNPDLNPNKKQELGKYIESLGWPCINRTKSGGYRVSKKEFAEWEKQGHLEVKTLNEYSQWVIVWNTFIGADSNYEEDEYDGGGFEEIDDESFSEDFFTSRSGKVIHHDATGLWQYRTVDNKVHTTFHAFMTKSHRHRCVAKGTKVLINRGYNGDPAGVPIEEVKVGDYAFCFDENCKPVLKKVTWVGKTGHKKIIRLHWLGSHNHRGYLDITPDHKIRLSDGSYCEAHNLLNSTMPMKKHCRKASVLAMRRIGDRLFATNFPDTREYRFVYEQLSGKRLSSDEVIHHKDGNHNNHVFSNLEVMSNSEHSLFHVKDGLMKPESRQKNIEVVKYLHSQGHYEYKKGIENHNYKDLSKTACIRMLVRARGRPSYVPGDFNTFKKKLTSNGLRWEDIAIRYAPNGEYLSKHGLFNDLITIGFNACFNKRGIGYYKLRKLCDSYGITYERAFVNKKQIAIINNHAVTRIEYIKDTVDVYDLTVEDTHNFIANEICVSNSSSPNLQNIPKRNYEVSQIVRQCYTYPRVVPCKQAEAEEIYVFDWKNGMTLHKPDDLVEIGLADRIKVPAKELIKYPQREFGYRAEYYRLSTAEDYCVLECDGSNLQSKIAASMSHDKNLCKLFLDGGDFHTNNAYHILAKYQLFDKCAVTFQSGKTDVRMEYDDCKVIRKGKEVHAYYNELEPGDIMPSGEVVALLFKAGESISYDEYCKNAKKGKCKELRQIGKMIGLSFIFGAGANNLAGGTLRMAWTPKKCQEFIRERKLSDLLNQTVQHNKKLSGDNLYYYVVSAFFRAEFFKLYPELEQWICECARNASVAGYVRSPWGSRRLLPELTYQGKHSDGGMLKNLSNISVNSPVQDYETVVMASVMASTDEAFEELGYISYMPGMVHDSVVTIAYKDELDSVLKIELSAFDFQSPAAYGIPYGGECNVAYFTKGEFWGFGKREVELDEVKDVAPIRKKYRTR